MRSRSGSPRCSRVGRSTRLRPSRGSPSRGGVLVFSGSLYALAVSGARWLGAITPIGGVLLLVGWAALVVAALAVR